MVALSLLTAAASVAAIIMAARLAGQRRRAARTEASGEELRTALSGAAQDLRGVAATLARQGGGPAAASAWQLLGLADELAGTAGGHPSRTPREAPAPLAPMLDAAIENIAGQLRPAQRHWQVEPALRALVVKGDRLALEGALTALMRRAASHSRNGDVIALRRIVAGDTVAIVVEDEGDGLPAVTRAESAAAEPGLSLARSLVLAHGGDVSLESAPGIGARAWLTLPRARVLEAA